MNKKNNFAFTLIEIMVAITIIAIIISFMRNINFTKISNEQKSERFANKIISKIEEARNNSATWKWTKLPTWESIIVDNWVIELYKDKLKVNIHGEDGYIREIEEIIFWKNEKIEKLLCKSNDREVNDVYIIFEKIASEIDECKNSKKLEIISSFLNERFKIEFDLVNWLLKKEKISN